MDLLHLDYVFLFGLAKAKAQPKAITKFALNHHHPHKLLMHFQVSYEADFRYAAQP